MIQRVLVEKDGIYYQCKAKFNSEYVWKCGKCLFGNIIAFIEVPPLTVRIYCARCGAKFHSTVYGNGYFDMKEFTL